jgi:serine/threonine-protein kinase
MVSNGGAARSRRVTRRTFRASAWVVTDHPLTVGRAFGQYRIDELVAQNPAGALYRAYDTQLKRDVALKVIDAGLARDRATRERLNRESRLVASLAHPNIAPLYDAGEADGLLYLASGWVQGRSLESLVRDDGPLSPDRAVAIATQVADALHGAHARGIVHRDVQPSHVLVTPDDVAYLTDFALARRETDMVGLTQAHQVAGTLDFAAPEQIRGDTVDGRADIYGLGGVMFYALTAAIPFEGDGHDAKLVAHLTGDPPSARAVRADIPEELDGVIARALARNPGHRQPTMARFGEEALAAVGHDDTAIRWGRAGDAAQQGDAGMRSPARGDNSLPPEPVAHIVRAIAVALVAAAIPALVLYMLLP